MRKILYFLLILVLLGSFFGCQDESSKSPVLNASINIEEFIFKVEEAVGDRYNIRIVYSLRRQDGEKIDPQIEFGELASSDGLRSLGASVAYSLSEDGKTIWIVEECSSSDIYDNSAIHTVTLRDLKFSGDSSRDSIRGEWTAKFRVTIDEEYKELCEDKVKIQIPDSNNYYYELTSIQFSEWGIHMEMKIPDNDISEFMKWFDAYIVLQDGSTVDLEMHHSIRGKKEPFTATAETMFDDVIAFGDVYALVVCGHEIIV